MIAGNLPSTCAVQEKTPFHRSDFTGASEPRLRWTDPSIRIEMPVVPRMLRGTEAAARLRRGGIIAKASLHLDGWARAPYF